RVVGVPTLLSQMHEPERLAVALGMRHPEVTGDLLARVPPLLMADHDDAPPLESGEAADDRGVVAVHAVAVELDEVVEQELEESARVRPPGVARELCALPGRQARVGLLPQPREPILELGDLLARLLCGLLSLEARDAVFAPEGG